MKKEVYQVSVLLVALAVNMVGCANYSEEDGEDVQAAVEVPYAGQVDRVGSISNRDDHFTMTQIEISQGDTLELIPNQLVKERFTQTVSAPKHEDHDTCVQSETVCLETAPVYQRQCHNDCHICVHCSAWPPGCYPDQCCDQVCQDVQVGTKCTRSETHCLKKENQWTETKNYSDPKSNGNEEVTDQASKLALALSGIQLQFLDQNGKTRGSACPLKNFNPKISPNAISIPVLNAKGCDHFFGDSDESKLKVTVANRIELPKSFTVGDEVHTWDNRTIPAPKSSAVTPRTEFTGTLRVPAK